MTRFKRTVLVNTAAIAALVATIAAIALHNRDEIRETAVSNAVAGAGDTDSSASQHMHPAAAQAQETAKLGEPARIPVELPAVGVKSGVSLVVDVSAYEPSKRAEDTAIVSVRVPGVDEPIVVGRFGVFPRQSFDASSQTPMQFGLRLKGDARGALDAAAGQNGVVEVALVDALSGKPAVDASMTIRDAKFVGR